MAELIGRKMLLNRSTDGGTTWVLLAGIQSKSLAINNEPVDITTDDSAGYRKLLADPGVRSIDISFSGVTTDEIMRAAILAGTLALEDAQIEFGDGAEITGQFFLANMTETGETAGAITFEGSLQSTGAWTYTPAP